MMVYHWRTADGWPGLVWCRVGAGWELAIERGHERDDGPHGVGLRAKPCAALPEGSARNGKASRCGAVGVRGVRQPTGGQGHYEGEQARAGTSPLRSGAGAFAR